MDFPAGLAAPSAIRNPGQGRRRRSRLLLAAVSLLAFAAAGAQEVEYTFKPGDNPWSIAFEHLKPGMVDALVEHNGIRDPYRIAPGTVIRIPDQWLFRGARPVTVVDVGGEAMLIPRRGPERALRPGDRLTGQSRIRTPAQGSVTLQFPDGSRLLVRENSDVRLQKNSFVPLAEGRDIRLEVPGGKVENAISPQGKPGGRFEIRTPSGVAAVRGTRFRLASAASGTRTEVLSGKVAVADRRGATAALPAGYGVAIQNGRNGPRTQLLAAPQIAAESLLVEQLPIDLPLPPVAQAAGYRTLVSAPGVLTATLSDQLSEAALLRIRDIPDGDYQVRVRAVDRHGLEGEESLRPLTVNARPSAPFPLAPKAEARLSAERPAFSWTSQSSASGYHFQLADNAAFKPLLIDAPGLAAAAFQPAEALPEGQYYWRLATVSGSEGRGPFSPPESFLRVPSSPGNINMDSGQRDLRWQAQPRARYHVQIAARTDMAEPTIDRVVDENRIALDDLSAGSYHVRIQTLGEGGMASAWSDIQSFTVESRFNWGYLLPLLPLLLLL